MAAWNQSSSDLIKTSILCNAISIIPFPGCGVWADDVNPCCNCLGYGEIILTELLTAKLTRLSMTVHAMQAVQIAMKAFGKKPQTVGWVIMIMKETGEHGLFHNTEQCRSLCSMTTVQLPLELRWVTFIHNRTTACIIYIREDFLIVQQICDVCKGNLQRKDSPSEFQQRGNLMAWRE